MATIEDVARHAGVSIRTVSRVLNDRPDVAPATRARVQQAIAALSFRPNTVARSMVTGSTRTIGVVLPDISNPFFSRVVRGCEDALAQAGYNMFLCNTDEDVDKERDYLALLRDRQVDGLILWGCRLDGDALHVLIGPHLPVVAVDCTPFEGNVTRLDVANQQGATTITRHLIGLGHERIGHLAGPQQRLTAQHRLNGYRRALADAGLAAPLDYMLEAPPSVFHGYSAALELLKPERGLTAIVAYNDLMAIGAILASQQMGRRVPQDVAIVGFDDIVTAALVRPALTTMRIDQYRIGVLSGQRLIERVKQPQPAQASTAEFPTALIVRHSCGARGETETLTQEMLQDLIASISHDMQPEEKESLGILPRPSSPL
ncbi:MAG: LacI family DNA-binding transcriptional regulator [Anaerolineae bacterium]|nr:LacI family DNA-binding transcriptional regulator [Anaerolineae bacterium]